MWGAEGGGGGRTICIFTRWEKGGGEKKGRGSIASNTTTVLEALLKRGEGGGERKIRIVFSFTGSYRRKKGGERPMINFSYSIRVAYGRGGRRERAFLGRKKRGGEESSSSLSLSSRRNRARRGGRSLVARFPGEKRAIFLGGLAICSSWGGREKGGAL